MPKYVFGKTLTFSFIPTIDGEPVKVHSLVSAYLFADEPTDSQIDNPSGYIGSPATSWTDNGEYEKQISFPALTDPDEHSAAEYESYFVLTKFRYESGGPVKWTVECIYVFRPTALTSRITVTPADVLALEPSLEDHKSLADLERFIAQAKKDIFRRYSGLGLKRKRMFNLEELNDATLYRAAALADISLLRDNARHWKDLYDLRNAQYEEVFHDTAVNYDTDGDRRATPNEVVGGSGSTAWIIR